MIETRLHDDIPEIVIDDPSVKRRPDILGRQIGLNSIVEALRRYRDRLGDDFGPSPQLTRRAAEARPLERQPPQQR
ncbi:hypothetical protein GCM10009087_50150 [Sphingomonas oligophenolica]|uniref:Uncharacterized protein n=1 Tax=Sphingomonas oligophenolica TaxID=301154 RepID=A0ABU9YB50_9SPHN